MSITSKSLVKSSTFGLSVPKATSLFGVASLEVARQMLQNRRDGNPQLTQDEHNMFDAYQRRLTQMIRGGSIPTLNAYVSTAIDEVARIDRACSQLVSRYQSRFTKAAKDSASVSTSYISRVAECIEAENDTAFPESEEHPCVALTQSASETLETIHSQQSLVREYQTDLNKLNEEFESPLSLGEDNSEFLTPPEMTSGGPLHAALDFFLSVLETTPSDEFPNVEPKVLSNAKDAVGRLRNAANQLASWYLNDCDRLMGEVSRWQQLLDNDREFTSLRCDVEGVYRREVERVLSRPNRDWITDEGMLSHDGLSVPKPSVTPPSRNFKLAVSEESAVREKVRHVVETALPAALESAKANLSQLLAERATLESENLKEGKRAVSRLREGYIKEGKERLGRLSVDKAISKTSEELSKQQNRLGAIQDHINSAHAILKAHRKTAKGTISGRLKDWAGFAIDDEAPMVEHLEAASNLVVNSGWSDKSDAYKVVSTHAPVIRKISEYCEAVFEWKPTKRKAKLDMSIKPRDLAPLDIFINALCCLAAADGTFCAAEKKTIIDFLLQYRLCDQQSAKDIISAWSKTARSMGVVLLTNQCLRDTVDLVRHPMFAKALPVALRLVGEADGVIEKSEKHIYREFSRALEDENVS